jgi:arylsulfatase A-like enzyme
MKPNILFIFADQHRHNIMGCAGHPLIKTPHLDAIASEGVRFTKTWCQSPICQPSRASVITGRYPHELDVISNTGGFNPEWPTVMKQLQGVGYETATIGKTHYHESYQPPKDGGDIDMRSNEGFVKSFGWDYVMEEYDKYLHTASRLSTPYTEHLAKHGMLDAYRKQIKSAFRLTPEHWRGQTSVLPQEFDLTSFLADEANQWLRQRSKDKPFMLKLAFVQPHVPLISDPVWAKYYADAAIDVPALDPAEASNEHWQQYLSVLAKHSQSQMMDPDFVTAGIRQYFGMVSLVDQKIGEVLATLEALGQLDNTWIIYTSDHGEMLGDHKLWAKMNFYHGSVQVPLIIRPPGGAPQRTEDALVELTDVTATLADIGGAESPAGSHGESLLAAVTEPFAGREYLYSQIGNYAGVRNSSHRLTMNIKNGAPCELFNMVDDPDEMVNLVNQSDSIQLVDDLSAQLRTHLAG